MATPKARPSSRRDPGLAVSRLFFRSHPVRHDGIGVAVAHAVLGLEPGHHFHVLHARARLEQVKPMRHGLTVFLFDRRKIRSGTLGFFRGGHNGFFFSRC